MTIKTKVIKRPKMTWWENSYFPEIFKGVLITSKHFWKNAGIHFLHSLGFFKAVRAGVTYFYPEEKRPTASRLRTRHRLTKREDGSPRCVACMMCETVCPANCIYIVAEQHPDPKIEKRPASFDINLGKCVYCGFCVEACPEDAIRMDTQILDIAALSRDGLKLDMQELLNPNPDYARILVKK